MRLWLWRGHSRNDRPPIFLWVRGRKLLRLAVGHGGDFRSWHTLCDQLSLDRFGTITGEPPIQLLRSVYTSIAIYLHIILGTISNPTARENGNVGSLAGCEARGEYVEEGVCTWQVTRPGGEDAGQSWRCLIYVGLALKPGTPAMAVACAGSEALVCSKDALAPVLVLINHGTMGYFVGLAAALALPSVVLMMIYGQTRIFFTMSRDGLLPNRLSKVHPRFRTPYVGTILTGLFVATFAGFANIAEVVDLTNIGTLFAFVLVSAGVIFLRRTEPDRHRPFRVPGVPFTPIISILAGFYLMIQLPVVTWIRFGIWLSVGLVFYFLYGYKHSVLRHGGSRPPAL